MRRKNEPFTIGSSPDYAQWGMAAVIPGLERAVEILQAELDAIRLQLRAAIGPRTQPAPVIDVVPHRALPPARSPRRVTAGSNNWANMTPEERSQEMRRRMQVAAQNKAAAAPVVKLTKKGEPFKPHPSDPASPNHATWLTNVSKRAKKTWEGMTVKQRKARLMAMRAGRTDIKANGHAEAGAQ